MPLELQPFLARRALADFRGEDAEAAVEVEGALEWLGARESDAEPLLITRYDLQVFLWYQLPCKWLVPLEHKQAVAVALGRFLERVGASPDYAALCRSEDTRSLLASWEKEAPAARARFYDLLDASGLEPPDTPLLAWGSVMGFVEARLHYDAAISLEAAVEEGRLDPTEAGFERRRAAHVEAFLHERRAELHGRTGLEAIHDERIEGWAERGSERRRELLRPVAARLREPALDVPSAAIEASLEPLLWLLGLAAEGLQLTQTGALSRALVRAAVERYPDWWRSDIHGPPHREDDVGALCELDDLARRLRLLRRKGQKLFLTRRGAALRGDPRGLLRECAGRLLSPRPFAAAVQELAAAALLAEMELEWDALEARVHEAVVSDGWNAAGKPPELRAVSWIVADLVRPARELGILHVQGVYPAPRRLILTEAGRLALQTALRMRATEPARTHL